MSTQPVKPIFIEDLESLVDGSVSENIQNFQQTSQIQNLKQNNDNSDQIKLSQQKVYQQINTPQTEEQSFCVYKVESDQDAQQQMLSPSVQDIIQSQFSSNSKFLQQNKQKSPNQNVQDFDSTNRPEFFNTCNQMLTRLNYGEKEASQQSARKQSQQKYANLSRDIITRNQDIYLQSGTHLTKSSIQSNILSIQRSKSRAKGCTIEKLHQIFDQDFRNETMSDRKRKFIEDYSSEYGCENLKLQRYTFQPQIDKKSNQMAQMKSNQSIAQEGRFSERNRVKQIGFREDNKIMFRTMNGPNEYNETCLQSPGKSVMSVHDKLHKQASVQKEKIKRLQQEQADKYKKYMQSTAINSELSQSKYIRGKSTEKSRNHEGGSQTFKRLYDLGQAKMLDLQRKIEESEKKKVQKDLESVTFQPKIDKRSVYLMSQRDFIKPEERLLKFKKTYENDISQKRKELNRSMRKECPHQPSINEASKNLAGKQRSKSRHDPLNINQLDENGDQQVLFRSLYQDAKQRESSLKKLQYEQLKELKQNMHQRSKSLSKLSQKVEEKLQIQRLNETKVQLYERLFNEKLGSLISQDQNQETIEQPMSTSRSRREGSLKTMKLYAQSREQSIRRLLDIEVKNQEIDKEIKEAKLISDISNVLIDKLRDQKIKELFQKLDMESKGQISYDSLDLSVLSMHEQELLADIFYQIDSEKLILDYQQFKRLLKKKISTLNVDQRNLLLGPSRRDPKFQPTLQSFKPLINEKTQNLALSVRSARSFRGDRDNQKQLYKFLNQEHEQRENTKKQKIRQKQVEEVKDCTFNPKTNKIKNSLGYYSKFINVCK
eukprot:403336809